MGSKNPLIPADYQFDDQATDAYTLIEEAHLEWDKGILLYGPPGTGKTTLLAQYANEHLRRPLPTITHRTRAPWLDREAIWATVAEYVEDVKAEINMSRRPDFTDFGDSFSASGIARSVPMLFLDDLGAEADTDYSRSAVESLIDARYRCRDERWTWFTTNHDLAELARRYSTRTVSRLCDLCELVSFDGDDRRVARAMARK